MLASTIAPIANVSLDKGNELDMDTFLNRETELRQRIVPGLGKIKLTLKFCAVQVIIYSINSRFDFITKPFMCLNTWFHELPIPNPEFSMSLVCCSFSVKSFSGLGIEFVKRM